MEYRQLFILTAVALTGCGTTYYNPNITDPQALEHQRVIDEGYCTRVGAGSVPMPEVRHYQSGVQNYQITGTVRTYGSGGYSNSNYTANVSSYPNAGDAFSAGVANGANLGMALAAARERKQIIESCMYSLGWTTDKNAVPVRKKTQGEEFFEKALDLAERGDPKMQARVANAYLEGEDAPKDIDKAVYWLKKASAQGHSESSFQLAYIYSGYVAPGYKDSQMMVLHLQTAAEQGEGMAQSMLANMYAAGMNGLPKSLEKAVYWFRLACSNDDAMGFFGMGMLYAKGEGVDQDFIQAHRFLSRSEQLGYEEAAPFRDQLEQLMTEAQLAEARRL